MSCPESRESMEKQFETPTMSKVYHMGLGSKKCGTKCLNLVVVWLHGWKETKKMDKGLLVVRRITLTTDWLCYSSPERAFTFTGQFFKTKNRIRTSIIFLRRIVNCFSIDFQYISGTPVVTSYVILWSIKNHFAHASYGTNLLWSR